ncbi:MAG TPA: ABC transporter substrate-binding protein [Propylenella sp.]|nr:ABC transporter substrate-binding protein [Propylenella sp.]
MKVSRVLLVAGSLLAAGLGASAPAAAQGNLVVYCSPQEEWCQLMVNEFQKATGINVSMTRKSSGETFAQIQAEAANPQGDIWWGGTGDPHLQAAEEDLTVAYESPMMAELHDWAVEQHKTADGKTVGIYLGALGFGYNSDLLKEKGLAAPECWADLAKPEFAGEVQVANPNSSGTAYTFLATLVQIWGEDKAFEYLKSLDANVNQYTKSGAAPSQAAARGETLVGITFQHDLLTPVVTSNAPLVTVSPCEGTGFEVGSMSIIKGGPNPENAKKWYDWALTADAQKLGAQANAFQLPSNQNAPLPEGAPDIANIKLIDYDFAKFGSSDERKRLLAKWDAEIGAN